MTLWDFSIGLNITPAATHLPSGDPPAMQNSTEDAVSRGALSLHELSVATMSLFSVFAA